MANLRYKGSCSSIKIPTNRVGEMPPDGRGPCVTCFLVWESLPESGDIIISLDREEHPYAYRWALSTPRSLGGASLFDVVDDEPTVSDPVFYRPDLPNAVTGE